MSVHVGGRGPGHMSRSFASVFSPLSLFPASEAGAWYDPSDLTTLFQDSAGTTPAVVGQPVGLMLDKRLGLTLGAEIIPAGQGDGTSLTGWTNNASGTVSLSGGAFKIINTGAAEGLANYSFSTTAGNSYRVTFDVVETFGGATGALRPQNANVTGLALNGVGNKSLVLSATGASMTLRFGTNDTTAGDYIRFDNLSVKPLPGNHAAQATTSLKPTLQLDAGGYYLLFDGVDDWLRGTFTMAQPWDRVSAVQQISWTSADVVFGGVTAAAGIITQAGTTPALQLSDGTATASNTDLAVAANGVLTETHNGASSRLAANNSAYTTGNSGTTVPGGITVGASDVGAAAGNIRFYGTVMRQGALTDPQIAKLRTSLGSKAGLTL